MSGFGKFVPRRREQRAKRRNRFRLHRIENVLPDPPMAGDPLPLEQSQTGGDSRLAHPEDFLELGYRQLLFEEQQKQPQPRRIGDCAQRFDN